MIEADGKYIFLRGRKSQHLLDSPAACRAVQLSAESSGSGNHTALINRFWGEAPASQPKFISFNWLDKTKIFNFP